MLLIDNVDSFTYNIADLLHRVLGQAPTVWAQDHRGDLTGFAAIVVGPGPGRPQRTADMGLSLLALQQREIPVLGICLGHQGLAHLAGDAVVELAAPMHGRVSEVVHDGTGIFEAVPSQFRAVRYHSLEVRAGSSPSLLVTARAADDGVVMALADPGARRWGLQFHPESVLSEHGEQLVANFLRLAGVRVAGVRVAGAETARRPVTDGDRQPVAIGDVHQPLPTSTAGARRVRVAGVALGPAPDTWTLHQRVFADSPTAFWLDASGATSSPGTGLASARCSVLGDASGPLSYLLTHRVASGDDGPVTELSTGERLTGPLLPNLARLRNRLQLVDAADPLGAAEPAGRFRPGFVGYLGYELKAELGGSAAHVSPHPDARLVLADRALVVDHEQGVLHAVYLWDEEVRAAQEAWVEAVRSELATLPLPDADRAGARIVHSGFGALREGSMQVDGRGGRQGPADELAVGERPVDGPVDATFRHTEASYLDLIAQCQEQIRAGESYEICLTNTASWPGLVDEVELARQMRTVSPVPFAAWLRGPGPTVLSASPERFVSVTADGMVEARPIKGTRPRGTEPATDAALAEELRSSVKERAENLMIVDLLRNDLHRVCRSGSVHVPEIFEVESYATVHQLVSTVRGQLAEGMDCLDVIGTCFPGGSMTGAPKVRTMEILDRLEGGTRGVYSGALGWIGLDGAMDLSIVIRTVTLVDGTAGFGVGGAITALSDPAEEYAETQVKAAALTSALRAATVCRKVRRNRTGRSSPVRKEPDRDR
ncbi:aminodeoxychorismate synthase component I [Ornithinimicrobium ciconiae]|uniref:aminodeoxychorismate synthase component I n=1 Tax=Ornithinimicrobium ciconiae TaxID=2594265 RepID=UPI00192D5112|nr:aminodeoxychorismate synthase component I [Ornithinimicrobium ciconiae]